MSASDIFEVIVTPKDDPPILDLINNQTIDEDQMFIYSLSAIDYDGDDLEFNAYMDSTLGSISLDENLLKVIPNDNYNGNIDI